jgi:hypothetical protein
MEEEPPLAAEPLTAEPFPVSTLRGSPSSHKVLDDELPPRRERKPECDDFTRCLYARLRAVHDAVARAAGDKWKDAFCYVVKRFIRTLSREPLLERLAGGETAAYTLRDLNAKLDRIFAGVGLLDPHEGAQWMVDWERGCFVQTETLEGLVEGSSARVLINEMKDPTKVTKVMMDMFVWLQGNASSRLYGLKQRTLERLMVFLNLSQTRVISAGTVNEPLPPSILSVFSWFTPKRDVELGEVVGYGTCGSVTRTTWRHRDGTVQDVVVKALYSDTASDTRSAFLKQLQLWSELPEHPSVVKLYGGNHLDDPPFFVCENADGGDIVEFFSDAEHREMVGTMFLQVAEGLQALHAHNIVHGGLRGSNILIGGNNTPKISDFNCSRIRTLSATVSKQHTPAISSLQDKSLQEIAARWEPREKLQERANALPQPKSDVYSLGMCMIEAVTQDIPFGMEEEDEGSVFAKILAAVPYERPGGVSDAEWGVIAQLISPNIDERPDIKGAIDLIGSLVPAAAKPLVQPSTEAARQAPLVDRPEPQGTQSA